MKKTTKSVFVLSLLCIMLFTGTLMAKAGEGTIVSPDAQPEKLFGDGIWTEGPGVGPDGKIYFADITVSYWTDMSSGNIWVYDPKTGSTQIFRSPSGMAAAVKFDAEGRMVTTEGADFGGRRITRTDMKTGLAKIVAATYKGHPFNSPNDLDIDSKGRIYFTDPRYFGSEPIEQPVAGVYRIDTDGSVHLILADMRSPNGIAISTDEKTLYVSEVDLGVNEVSMLSEKVPQQFGKMQIKAYDLQPDGTAINGRVFVDYGSEKGADGLTVDQDGNLYAGVQAESRLGIRIYSPAGEEIGSIPFTESPRNMVLVPQGEGAVLYVTAGKSLYQIPTSIPPRKWAQQN